MPTRDSIVAPRPALAARPGRIPVGTLPLVSLPDRIDPLIRRLALDRLRDLRDDGVTTEYIGRMYGVSAERIRLLEEQLRS